MSYDVIVSGYISLDRVIKVSDEMTYGKTSIVSNHEHLFPEYGGCGINFAIDVSKLGLTACPIIRVGHDYESSGFKKYIEKNHLMTTAIKQFIDIGTSCSYLIEDHEMNHVTLYYPGAMDQKYFRTYDHTWFENAKIGVMTVASYVDNQAFLRHALKANLKIYLGMKLDKQAFPKEFIMELTNHVNGIFANEEEYKYLLESTSSKDHISFFNASDKLEFIVITKGVKGSEIYYRQSNEIMHLEIPILKTENFVSSVGGGDAFMAGFIYGLMQGETIEKSMYLGATESTFAIEGKGATTNAPNKMMLYRRCKEAFNI